MSSPWTHALCFDCYEAEEPGRGPVTVGDAPAEVCCRCGKPTTDGIYYRAHPSRFTHCQHPAE